MTLAIDFRADLLSVTAVSTIVGTRVYPLVDRGKEVPSIVYTISSDNRAASFGNRFYNRERAITVRLYTMDYNDLATMTDAIRGRYDGFFGRLNGTGVGVAHSEVSNVVESFDSVDDLTYTAVFTIILTTRD